MGENLSIELKENKSSKVSFVSLLLVLAFWITLFNAGIFMVLGQILGQLLILTIWLVSLFVTGKNAFKLAVSNIKTHSLEITLISFFVLVNAIHLIIGNGDMAYANFVKSLILLVVYITILVHLKNAQLAYRQSVIFILLFFGALSLYVTPILASNPFIARMYEFTDGEIPWFGSWSFFMPIAISLPCFVVVAAQQKIFLRIVLYTACISISIMIILSTFAASIILLIGGGVGLLFFSIKKKRQFLLIGGTIFLIFFMLVKFYDYSEEMPQVAAMVDKIGTIFTYKSDLANDDNDPRIRASLIQKSIKAFLENPFFGTGLYSSGQNGEYSNLIGQHSGIMDGLAQYGIFGIIWYFGFLYLGLRRLLIYIRLNSSWQNKARLITFLLFIIGAMGNPVLIENSFASLVFILTLSPIGSGKLLSRSNSDTLMPISS